MNTLEKLVVALGLDDSEYEKGLSGAQTKSNDFGKNLLKGMGGALTGIATMAGTAMVGVAGFISSTIGPASDLSETVSKVGVVFGDSAADIIKWGQTAASSMGMSTNTALAAAGTYGNLFTAMGITKEKSGDMSQGLVQLAADLASFNNMDPTQVLDSLCSGLSGETEQLKRLGVNLNQATVEAKAIELGLWDGVGTIDAAAKAQATYALVMEQTKTAQGDYARTSDGLANTQRSLSATFEDIKTVIGGAFLPIVNQGAGELYDFAMGLKEILTNGDDVGTMMGNVGALISDKLSEIMTQLPGVLEGGVNLVVTIVTGIVQTIPTILPAIVQLITTFINGIVTLMPIILNAGMQIILALLNAFLPMLPMLLDAGLKIIVQLALGIAQALPTLIPTVVQTLLALVDMLIQNIPMLIDAALAIIMGLADGILAALPLLIEKLPQIIISIVNTLIQNLPKILQMALQIILALANGLVTFIPQLILQIPQIMIAIVDGLMDNLPMILQAAIDLVIGLIGGFLSMIPQLLQAGKDIMQGFWDGLKSMFSRIWESVKEFAGKIVDAIKEALKIASPSGVFFDIGMYTMQGMAEGIERYSREPLQMTARVSGDLADVVNVRGVSSTGGKGGNASMSDLVTAMRSIKNPSPEENARAFALVLQQYGLV